MKLSSVNRFWFIPNTDQLFLYDKKKRIYFHNYISEYSTACFHTTRDKTK